ncbi:hypothetical protein SAMN06295912_1505 [Sphingomonas laterariae]|uniref:LexA DNA binding domain-containing protein n=1 Tax=Edaphosphingomonas laterariae TaxID=861865 RepID=A0A239KC79_9SPHN|nr:hypothetical protein [Sphingomonas laterariae]SNT15685.1 hypothetical protein SAMN06295912_1505 [Sphingomonas laterariae]
MGYTDPRLAEALVFTAVAEAADVGAPCPSNQDLADIIDGSVSSPPYILTRLQRQGLIAIERYQKERRITIVETGKQTAPVRNPAIHWRNRKRNVPAPAITAVRQRDNETGRRIIVAARREGMDVQTFLTCMVAVGFAEYERSIHHEAMEGVGG